MTAKYQAIGTIQSGVAALTVSWPTHATGDIGLLLVETADQDPAATWPPTGWTLVNSSPVAVAGKTKGFLLWKRAASNAEGSVTVPDSGDHQVAVIMTIRGALQTGNPIRAYVNEGSGGDVGPGTYVLTTSLSPASMDDCLVLAACHNLDQSTANFSAWTSSSGIAFTERFDTSVIDGNGGGIGFATSAPGSYFTSAGQGQVDVASLCSACLFYVAVISEPTHFFVMF